MTVSAGQIYPGCRPLRGVDLEELQLTEAKHHRDESGWEALNQGVVVADHRVVVTAGVLKRVFDIDERRVQLEKAFVRLEVGIGFDESQNLRDRELEL